MLVHDVIGRIVVRLVLLVVLQEDDVDGTVHTRQAIERRSNALQGEIVMTIGLLELALQSYGRGEEASLVDVDEREVNNTF